MGIYWYVGPISCSSLLYLHRLGCLQPDIRAERSLLRLQPVVEFVQVLVYHNAARPVLKQNATKIIQHLNENFLKADSLVGPQLVGLPLKMLWPRSYRNHSRRRTFLPKFQGVHFCGFGFCCVPMERQLAFFRPKIRVHVVCNCLFTWVAVSSRVEPRATHPPIPADTMRLSILVFPWYTKQLVFILSGLRLQSTTAFILRQKPDSYFTFLNLLHKGQKNLVGENPGVHSSYFGQSEDEELEALERRPLDHLEPRHLHPEREVQRRLQVLHVQSVRIPANKDA